jgi:hypothetical protein
VGKTTQRTHNRPHLDLVELINASEGGEDSRWAVIG